MLGGALRWGGWLRLGFGAGRVGVVLGLGGVCRVMAGFVLRREWLGALWVRVCRGAILWGVRAPGVRPSVPPPPRSTSHRPGTPIMTPFMRD